MNVIGNKIRMLRKNKNMTQEDLAEILVVSSQAISKLDALNYKERFIRFMTDNGVLKFGEFKLNSGRVSPYYIDTSCYKSAAQISKLGEFYADCMRENNMRTQLLYGSGDY